jgi:hypothetical protein
MIISTMDEEIGFRRMDGSDFSKGGLPKLLLLGC